MKTQNERIGAIKILMQAIAKRTGLGIVAMPAETWKHTQNLTLCPEIKMVTKTGFKIATLSASISAIESKPRIDAVKFCDLTSLTQ